MVTRLKSLEVENIDEAKRDIEIFANGDFKNDFYCVITDKKKNVMGLIIAVRLTRMTTDVSYFLKEEYRHNGYMQEALTGVIEVIRDDNPLARIKNRKKQALKHNSKRAYKGGNNFGEKQNLS